ncbi:hypothetical protein M728_002931 [Ensifer sp. WSM1721]
MALEVRVWEARYARIQALSGSIWVFKAPVAKA